MSIKSSPPAPAIQFCSFFSKIPDPSSKHNFWIAPKNLFQGKAWSAGIDQYPLSYKYDSNGSKL